MTLTPVQALPRVAGPLERPTWNNTRIDDYGSWKADNLTALTRWWWQCDAQLVRDGHPPGDFVEDFGTFCALLHTRELRKVRPT